MEQQQTQPKRNFEVAVLLSGGLDSTVLLYVMKREFERVAAICFDYGQRHLRELRAAREIAQELRVPIVRTRIDFMLDKESSREEITAPMGGSSQTSPFIAVPEGHYTDPSMRVTYVPNRNMIMLSIAASFALANCGGSATFIAYAAHAGDHAIYPDCRPQFVENLNYVLRNANYQSVSILTPFISTSKAGIVKLGASLKVPFEKTWSCYAGGERHCGRCGTCVERREAFHLAGVADPTEYEA